MSKAKWVAVDASGKLIIVVNSSKRQSLLAGVGSQAGIGL